MGRLDWEEFVHLAPDYANTERYNHDQCPAGADTKRRLYVTRKDDGSIIAYCHNCGNGGASLPRRTHYRRHDNRCLLRGVKEEVVMPLNAVPLNDQRVPEEALNWIEDAGIPLTIAMKYALAFDLDSHRVIIPKWDVDNELVMYQTRNVGLDDGPKYTTVRKKDGQIHDPIGNRGGTVVLCEDMLSAMKLDRMVGVDAIPLYSSNVKFDKLLTPLENYDTIVVWLDNDNIEVNRHRDSLVRKCRHIGKRCVAVTEFSDPKKCGVNALRHRVDEALKQMEDM